MNIYNPSSPVFQATERATAKQQKPNKDMPKPGAPKKKK